MDHRILTEVQRGTIDIDTAAVKLNTTPRRVRQMITVWADRLPALNRTLESLGRSFESRDSKVRALERAAEALAVSPRQVRRLLSINQVDKMPLKTMENRHEKREIALKKWGYRTSAALSFIDGADTIESAAIYASVTVRQMYRWVHKLLDPTGVDIRDLRHMKIHARRKLTVVIEKNLNV